MFYCPAAYVQNEAARAAAALPPAAAANPDKTAPSLAGLATTAAQRVRQALKSNAASRKRPAASPLPLVSTLMLLAMAGPVPGRQH